MIKAQLLLLCVLVGILVAGCGPKIEQPPEFSELRLHRWTALDGGEILVIRHLGSGWSADLLGDGERFSCLYRKSVKPKSDWQQIWDRIAQGMDNLPDGYKADLVVEDGDGFDVEYTDKGKLKRLSIPHPEFQSSPIGKAILEISDTLGREFDTPVFIAKYDRGEVGNYLVANCGELRK